MGEVVRIKSISDVHRIFNLSPPSHPLVSVIEIDDSIANFDYGDFRYTFDFYQINLKEGFSGSMLYGRNSYDFEEGTLTFIQPGQTIQVENHDEIKGSSGWTLLFHPDLIRRSTLGEVIDNYSFFNYSLSEALHLSEKEKEAINELIEKIKTEYSQNIDKHSQELIVSNIDLILKYCNRYYDRQFYTRSSVNKDILTKFDTILKEYYQSENPLEMGVLTVKQCADELALSVNYFGDLIKAETGKSAKEHIQDHVVNRAKNRLLNSKDEISQIAYSLGFEYAQGFNKLFKSKVGFSPSEFRRLN